MLWVQILMWELDTQQRPHRGQIRELRWASRLHFPC